MILSHNYNSSAIKSTYCSTLPQSHGQHVSKKLKTRKSPTTAISLPSSHISRTRSELQLSENIATAEWRDNCMFHRLVNGIREKQAEQIQYSTFSSFQSEDHDQTIRQAVEKISFHRYNDFYISESNNLDSSACSRTVFDHYCEANLNQHEEEIFVLDF